MPDHQAPAASEQVLSLTRLIPVSRAKLYRCWTEPELLKQWFCPPPWGVSRAEMDVRSGGASVIVMRGPDGQEVPNHGVYLEVVPNERIVFTDAYVRPWVPSGKPFMTATISFTDEAGQTRYDARVAHWTAADCEAHEKMGFHVGWGIATDQLAALAQSL